MIVDLFLIVPFLLSDLQLCMYLVNVFKFSHTLNGGMLIVSIMELFLKITSIIVWYKYKIIFSMNQLLSVILVTASMMFYLLSDMVNNYMMISYSIDLCLTLFVVCLNTVTDSIKVVPDDWVCSICLDTEKKLIVKTRCSHTFHLKCIEKSLDYSKLCPMCRAEII